MLWPALSIARHAGLQRQRMVPRNSQQPLAAHLEREISGGGGGRAGTRADCPAMNGSFSHNFFVLLHVAGCGHFAKAIGSVRSFSNFSCCL